MNKKHQEKWKELVETHWWPVANHSIVKHFVHDYLGKKTASEIFLLDVGCSNGKMMRYLSSFGKCIGMDLSFDAMLMCKEKSLLTAQADATNLPFKKDRFDAVTLLDVAEHVEEEEKLFRGINRVTKKGGYIFIMVPAHMSLWGSHDVMYGHKRRYRTRHLKRLAENTGFKVEKITYLHPLLFPVMFMFRIFDRGRSKGFGQRDDFRDFGFVLNKIFEKTLILDGCIARYVDYPFGTTLFSVWRKL